MLADCQLFVDDTPTQKAPVAAQLATIATRFELPTDRQAAGSWQPLLGAIGCCGQDHTISTSMTELRRRCTTAPFALVGPIEQRWQQRVTCSLCQPQAEAELH